MKTSPAYRPASGFNRTDLMAVLASLTLLMVLLIGLGNSTRTATEALGCENNSRRLIQAWVNYSADNLALVKNDNDSMSWAWGNMSWTTAADNTNSAKIQTRVFVDYIGRDTTVFRCPSDRFVSVSQKARAWRNRVRSYSMNYFIGCSVIQPYASGYRLFKKESDFVSPSETFVFTDEHPDGIDDPLFRGDPGPGKDLENKSNIPASFHNRGSTLSFADGHIELHRWHGTSFPRPIGFVYQEVRPTNDADFSWLARRVSQPVQ